MERERIDDLGINGYQIIQKEHGYGCGMDAGLLKEIAHERTGDKGEISNISVIPYDENNYEMLKEKVTETRVAEYFREICHGKVTRYELDGNHALNFVLVKKIGRANV